MHLYLALLCHRDYFSRPDASLSCFSVPQGLFRPDQMHLYLALLCHRDYFSRPDASLSCFSVPQGLFRPDQMHLYLPLFHHKDYFSRLNASQSCSFAPQGLFQPAGCIPIFLFFTAGIISPRLDTSPIAETISARPFRRPPI